MDIGIFKCFSAKSKKDKEKRATAPWAASKHAASAPSA